MINYDINNNTFQHHEHPIWGPLTEWCSRTGVSNIWPVGHNPARQAFLSGPRGLPEMSKMIDFVSIRCVFSSYNIHQTHFLPWLCPGPRWRSLRRSPRSPSRLGRGTPPIPSPLAPSTPSASRSSFRLVWNLYTWPFGQKDWTPLQYNNFGGMPYRSHQILTLVPSWNKTTKAARTVEIKLR